MNNMASASSVIDFYCSAARAEVTAAGIAVHALGTSSTATSGASIRIPTTMSRPHKPQGSGGPSKGAIAGAIVGAVVGLLIACCLVIYFMWRRGRMLQKQQEIALRPQNRGDINRSAVQSARNDSENIGRHDMISPAPAAESSSVALPPYEPGAYGDIFRSKNQ